MHRAGKFLGQCTIHQPLTINSRQPAEGFGDDLDMKMRLASGPGAGMPGMASGLVHDFKMVGRQRLAELAADAIGDGRHRAGRAGECRSVVIASGAGVKPGNGPGSKLVDASRNGRAAILLGLVIVLWGVNWPIMKVGLASIPPLTFALVRTLLGGLSLLVLLAASGRLRLPPRGDTPILLSVGILQIALFLGLTHAALMFVEAGRSAILAYTTPLWVVPLSALLLHERPNSAQLLALAFGMAGLAVLFNPLALDYSDTDALIGNGMLLAGAVAWALTILHVRAHRWRATPLELMPWQMLLGSLLLLPVVMTIEGHRPIRWSWELVVILAYNGPVASAFCYWAFVTVNRSFRASTTALGSLGVPVVGVMASTMALGEPLSAATVGGLALIAAGVVVLSLSAVRRAPALLDPVLPVGCGDPDLCGASPVQTSPGPGGAPCFGSREQP